MNQMDYNWMRKVDALLNQINNKLDLVLKKEIAMASELDTLTTQVASNTTVVGSAIALIQGLAAQIAANVNNPAALTALSNQLLASDQAMAAAIAANTPAAPAGAAKAAKKQ